MKETLVRGVLKDCIIGLVHNYLPNRLRNWVVRVTEVPTTVTMYENV